MRLLWLAVPLAALFASGGCYLPGNRTVPVQSAERTTWASGQAPGLEAGTANPIERVASPPEGSAKSPSILELASSLPSIPAPVAEYPLNLETALVLAGAENPTIALAREAIQASLADRMQARALLLPTLEAGTSFNLHQGPLLSAKGVVIRVDRESLYVGSGAFAVGAGTVGFPGVWLNAHLADALFEPRAASQRVANRRFEALAVRNAVLLDVVDAYFTLVGAEAALKAIRESESDLAEVVRLTTNFYKTGQGRKGDADRAEADALLLHNQEQHIEEEIAVAAARLSQLLSMDPAVRLRGGTPDVPLVELVNLEDPLERLIQIALQNRPEVGAQAANVAANRTELRKERFRPLLPLLAVGFSAGNFGGGSNLADQRFGHFDGRTDFDVLAVWSLENLGLGNLARQRALRAVVNQALAEQEQVIDRIRREVADAYALARARRRDLEIARRRVQTSLEGYQFDLLRIKGIVEKALPIELLNSLSLLTAAQQDLVRALVGYDEAQFGLFVALGQPPTLAVPPGERSP
jgi:outer membrane protein TolC